VLVIGCLTPAVSKSASARYRVPNVLRCRPSLQGHYLYTVRQLLRSITKKPDLEKNLLKAVVGMLWGSIMSPICMEYTSGGKVLRNHRL
jgi:hypothetical protein